MNIELKELSAGLFTNRCASRLRAQIKEQAVSAGETLPSPGALAQKLSVDKGEIQRAYFELEHSGLITKRLAKTSSGTKSNLSSGLIGQLLECADLLALWLAATCRSRFCCSQCKTASVSRCH